MKLFRILLYISFSLSFILFTFYLLRKKTFGFGAKFIFYVFLVVLLSDIYEIIATEIFSVNSALHYKIYLFTEFYLVLLYFYKLSDKTLKGFYTASAIIYFLLFLYVCFGYEWNFSKSLLTDSYLSAFETIMVYTFAIQWFTRIFRFLPDTSLLRLPDFYFVSGLIIYTSGPLFLFFLSSQIIQADPESLREYWMINNFFNIILKIFLIIGVWKIRK